MLRLVVAVSLIGCSESAPAVGIAPPPSFIEDTGPTRVCGVVPGERCEREGEIARCLCGSFEEQIGRFVCCRKGVAVVRECQQAASARDCDGNLVTAADAAD